MRKLTLFFSCTLAIALVLVSFSNAPAEVIQPMNPQMKQNLQDMSRLMASISNDLGSGQMSMEAQQAAASVTKQVSQILQELAEGNRKYDVHKDGVDQMKKAWQPFTEQSLTAD